MPLVDRNSVAPSTTITTPVDPTTTPVDPTAAATSTTSTTAASTTAATTGLDAATQAGPTPSAGGAIRVSGGTGVVLPQTLTAPSGPSKLAVLPGYPACVGLPDVLAKIAASPAADAALTHVFAAFEQETGIAIPPALQAVVRAHPERIADALVVTPRQMRAGFDAINAAARSGKLKPTAPKVRQLDNHVDVAKLDWSKITRSPGDLKELVPGSGLYKGDVPSALPDDQAKKNIAAAEIFDRLAGNTLATKAAKFSVQYGGKRFTTIEGYIGALRADGCKVTARIEYRAADFAALKLKDPRAPDGVVDVPAAILIKTGIKDAVLPAIHGELIFHVERGPDTKGPAFDADFKWYQGVPDTGFVSHDTNRRSTWLGRKTTATFEGDDAVRALHLAGNLGDVINGVAVKDGLFMNGYGITGVCLDSVGIIEDVLTGKISGWPLFMRDEIVQSEVKARENDPHRADDADLHALSKAIDDAPSDDEKVADPTAEDRIVASRPWTKADAPLQCVADAIDAIGR